ncbi:MAG: NADH-quinone oxidoreductase subunit N [Candidatus Kapabacteria bacterium]|jgi:NADH-quinone oxidoreductase subunit N|nr:NADH-quinone oxidoreductase subunit N [Candidatus Kapabacteria bacterium]
MIEQFLTELQKSLSLFKPESALVITFLMTLAGDLIFRKSEKLTANITLIGFVVTGFFLFNECNDGSTTIFSGMLAVDSFAKFFKIIILLSSIIVVIMSLFSKELFDGKRPMGEYYMLITSATFGMFLLSSATNMIMIYLSIEIMSISSYILAGYTKEINRASEASLKYVIFGAVSSGLMIYGISLLFGMTGSLNLLEINQVLATGDLNIVTLTFSMILIMAGIGYKISAVPFHFWTPDVYEGAPVTITAYLSVASKAAGFAVLIRFLRLGFTNLETAPESETWAMISNLDWQFIIAVLSVLTMTVGNLVALWQTNAKRMLAYSSIAHAGYILMAVAVMNDIGTAAVMIYFFVYMIMNLGAFFAVMLISNEIDSDEIEDYTGFGYRSPVLGIALVIFLISLTGLPPTAGFIGKYFVFGAVIDSGLIWLAVVGILNSVVSLYYYMKIVRNMFVRGVELEQKDVHFSPGAIMVLVALAIPTLVFGIYFQQIVEWAKNSVQMFVSN